MAARLAPDNVRRMHQSLHHLVADAPWSDAAVLAAVRSRVVPAMQQHGPVVAWIVDDTGFPKKGEHSVGVARQYCGQLGKQENCRVAVSLSVASWSASLPIACQLYLPEAWVQDDERRRQAGVPGRIGFQTKPQIAVAQIRQAVAEQVPQGVVLADAGYGTDGQFRAALTELELHYVVGVQGTIYGVGARHAASAAEALERPWAADETAAARRATSAGCSAATGPDAARIRLEDRDLAARCQTGFALAVRGSPCAAGTSRLLAGRGAPGRMAADGMAERRGGAHQVLALHAPVRHPSEKTSSNWPSTAGSLSATTRN